MPKQQKLSIFEWCLIAIIVFFIVKIVLPNFSSARTTAPFNAILANLRRIEGAKEQFIAESDGLKRVEQRHKTNEIPPNTSSPIQITTADINAYLESPVRAVDGETYVIGKPGKAPEAHLTHSIGLLSAGVVLVLEEPSVRPPGEGAMTTADYFERAERRQWLKRGAIAIIVVGLIGFVKLIVSRARISTSAN